MEEGIRLSRQYVHPVIGSELSILEKSSDWHLGFSFLYILYEKGETLSQVTILIINIHELIEFFLCFFSRFQGHETLIKLMGIQFFVGEQPIFH